VLYDPTASTANPSAPSSVYWVPGVGYAVPNVLGAAPVTQQWPGTDPAASAVYPGVPWDSNSVPCGPTADPGLSALWSTGAQELIEGSLADSWEPDPPGVLAVLQAFLAVL
jgi:hypothetical protein